MFTTVIACIVLGLLTAPAQAREGGYSNGTCAETTMSGPMHCACVPSLDSDSARYIFTVALLAVCVCGVGLYSL